MNRAGMLDATADASGYYPLKRPFIITGRDSWVLPGGLTRVALRKGTLIVK